ncbi:MAG: hypothetical protein QF535_14970, partial [Anaerolineales bacterium]|nr:hypothetical protein [Anaerolineales bacterium]
MGVAKFLRALLEVSVEVILKATDIGSTINHNRWRRYLIANYAETIQIQRANGFPFVVIHAILKSHFLCLGLLINLAS